MIVLIDSSKNVIRFLFLMTDNRWKLFAAACFTMIYIWAGELFPTDIRSNGLAVSSVAARIGGIIAPQGWF